MSARRRPMRVGAALSVGLLSALAAGAVACAEGAADTRAPERTQASLAPYTGRAAELFDDGIDPAALGYTVSDVAAPEDARMLRERTASADGVVRARVESVTSGDGEGVSLLSLHSLEPLAGARPPAPDFTLQLNAAHHAGILHALEGRSVGTTVVAFVSAFAGRGGRQEVHFHIGPDNKKQVDAIRADVLLDEVH